MNPFYFGDSKRALFGVHHSPAEGDVRRWGVVICPPFGQEYMRAHRALRALAARLARAGFHVLRFDYYGSGDSAGDGASAEVADWLRDIAAAVEEIEELSGSRRVVLVGLRLGASLAALAARECPGVERLVLWDPVSDGATYVEELEATHRAWVADHVQPPPAPEAVPTDEVLGFPFPEELRRSIRSIRPADLQQCRVPAALVLSSDEAGREGALDVALASEAVERRRLDPAPVWVHRDDGMAQALVPGAVLEHVGSWLDGACPS